MALATPAIVHGSVIIRTQSKLYRIAKQTAPRVYAEAEGDRRRAGERGRSLREQ
jgi:hypothetical protein